MEAKQDERQKKIERFIKRLPPLSPTVGKVMVVCSRTDASPNELNKVVSLDPVLTAQVLKMINSAYYSLVSKVTSLTRAITMLGMNTVKNLALSSAVFCAVGGVQQSRVIPAARFWQHSIATGVSARLFGEAAGIESVEREELFLAGLLHDLGKIPFGDEYAEVVALVNAEGIPFIEAERRVLSLDHQQVGMMIAEKWKLNTSLRQCIGRHHDLDSLAADSEHGRRIAFVALGNLYANIYDYGYAGDLYPREEDLALLLEITGVSLETLMKTGERVEEEIHRAEVFLHV